MSDRMNEKQKRALEIVLEYLHEEESDYYQRNEPEDHVFCSVLVLEEYLDFLNQKRTSELPVENKEF